ncbi:ABC transporter permease [Clostridium sardiniense]
MYFKLALRNLRRSLKDYTIYFFTLIFAVCVFYTFNSIKSQSVMMNLNSSQSESFDSIQNVIGIASIFVSFILGFLIVYANNYLIKRRKKEFGIYMTLGMEKGELSKIIFIETLLIGITSLVIGLFIGVLASQGLSILTANMFKVDLTKFQFIFSYNAFLKTIICFGIIYIIVLLFNSIIINKVKLIDLLEASRKNENLRVKNIWISVIIFVISIIMIGYAYYNILDNGIAKLDLISVFWGSVGTFLFFFSISGFFLKVVQSNNRIYLRDLNMFVFRQINSKINTTFISMTFICLMLFIAICTFSGGLGINKALNSEIKDLTQFDATFWSNKGVDIDKILKNKGVDIKKYSNEYVSYINFNSGVKYRDFLDEEGINDGKSYYPISENMDIQVIKLSKFNDIMKMLGKNTVKLEENNYMVFGDIQDMIVSLQRLVDSNKVININGYKLTPSKRSVLDITTYNQMLKNNICTFVVNDSIVDGLKSISTFLNTDLKGDKDEIEKELKEKMKAIDNKENNIFLITKDDLLSSQVSTGVMIAYLGIYIGIIFLVTSAAVLALQQLCDSTDNLERYKLLRKIGVDDSIINRSLLIQIGIYFMVPLSLALVHSIVGLKVSSDIVSIFGNESIFKNIIITVVVLLIIYGGYFIVTYTSVKKTIREKLNKR